MRRATKKRLLFFIIIIAVLYYFVGDKFLQPKSVAVLVAKSNLKKGDFLSSNNTLWKSVLAKDLSDKVSISYKKNLSKMVVLRSIPAGEFILKKYVETKSSSSLSPGMAVHAFKVDVTSGIGRLLKVGQSVRVVYVHDGTANTIINKTKVIDIYTPKTPKIFEEIIEKDSKSKSKKTNTKQKPTPKKYDNTVLSDVYVEVDLEMSQMLALDHKGKFILIPVSLNLDDSGVVGSIGKQDFYNRLFNLNKKKGRIKSIRGGEVTYDGDHKESKVSPPMKID